MKEKIRRTVVFHAAFQINKSAPSTVYSFELAKFTHMTPSYDFEEGEHISSSSSGLYHFGTGSHITLEINGAEFRGYDFDSSAHFQGNVNGNSVSVYDFQEGKFYYYSAS